jgi:NAD(P)-dependent dehydrogenase (short-subunit alcohol dehydrogenase family)
MSLNGKNILVTGAAYRLGRVFALAVARSGANVIIHHGHSPELAAETMSDAIALGVNAYMIQADLQDPEETIHLLEQALSFGSLYGLINSAAIFESRKVVDTDLDSWNRHLSINLTAPFLLSKYFAGAISENQTGKILNILDWRALQPGSDHFPYTISKAGLAAMTKSLALSFAPNIQVNGIALGAILPSSEGISSDKIINRVPAKRWAYLSEVEQTILFFLDGPSYITGEIIHLDGGRHLV